MVNKVEYIIGELKMNIIFMHMFYCVMKGI